MIAFLPVFVIMVLFRDRISQVRVPGRVKMSAERVQPIERWTKEGMIVRAVLNLLMSRFVGQMRVGHSLGLIEN